MAKAKTRKRRTTRRGPTTPRMTAEERKFRADQDLRTLREAEEIRKDTGRLRAATSLANQEIRALARVKGRQRR